MTLKNTQLETPPDLLYDFRQRHDLLFDFVDVMANKNNRKFFRFIDKKKNLFKTKIKFPAFCNPPFNLLYETVKYLHDQHKLYGDTVIMLVPCYTDSKWFQEFIGNHLQFVDDFEFIDHRLGFYKNGKEIKSNKYYMPCMFIVWRKNVRRD